MKSRTFKKLKLYVYLCPLTPNCRWKIVGNWKDKMLEEYHFHYSQEHFPDPLIQEIKEESSEYSEQLGNW